MGEPATKATGFNKSEPTAANSYLRWQPRYSISFGLKPGMLSNLLPASEFTQAVDVTRGQRLESSVHHECVILYTGYKERFTYSPDAFSRDWQGFSFLRVDVLPENAELKLRWNLEDDKVFPPVARRFIVPVGKWVALQVDLDKAIRDRALDLGKILNFWITLEETAAPTRLYFDNVRLSAGNVKPTLPLLTGQEKAPPPGQPITVAMKRIPSRVKQRGQAHIVTRVGGRGKISGMPRIARVAPGGVVFHVLNRGVGRMPLFRHARDFEVVPRVVEETLRVVPIRIGAYCWLPNHWHFVLWPQEDGQLSRFLQCMTKMHTQRGKVKRYRAEPKLRLFVSRPARPRWACRERSAGLATNKHPLRGFFGLPRPLPGPAGRAAAAEARRRYHPGRV